MSRAAQQPVASRVALITGAAKGIGLQTARELHRRGAHVVLLDRDQDLLIRSANGIGHERVDHVVADITDYHAMEKAVGYVIETFGRLDLVVANAGVAPPPGTLRSIDKEAFDRVIDINQTGTWNTVRATAEYIIAARGQFQLICSGAAFSPGVGGAAYMISKAAVEQLARALRIETAPYGVAVGTVYFGLVDTDMTHATIDHDPMGHAVAAQLPWPFKHRISVDEAARSIVDSIQTRAPRTVRPRIWMLYSVLRGIINPVVDAYLVKNAGIHRLVRRFDSEDG